jgi:hypothetical protein
MVPLENSRATYECRSHDFQMPPLGDDGAGVVGYLPAVVNVYLRGTREPGYVRGNTTNMCHAPRTVPAGRQLT